MVINTRNWIMAGMLGLLVACGGGGGGNSASGVDPGPPPPGQPIPPDPIPPTPSQTPYAEAEELSAYITGATIPDDGRPVVDFTLADGKNNAITDLTASDVRFTLAKLEASPLGNLTGSWQSYINRISNPDPEDGPGTEPALQATYERGTSGEFTNLGDGKYRYRLATSVEEQDADIQAQADSEGLDLAYEPDRTHRVGMQFDNAQDYVNPTYNWVPATGATDGIFTMDIAATANCNRCHDPLRIHGRRVEVGYCVTCHNPGSTDPSSTNTVNLKVMVHKIHMGANLPSVQAGGDYVVGGHDYSDIHFPQDVRNCENCHAGSATGANPVRPDGSEYSLALTSQGDNWSQFPSQAACGSCHDDLDFSAHAGGQTDDSNCASCHSEGGKAGSIQHSHLIPTDEARKNFAAKILSVTNTAPGEFPEVMYKVFDPSNDDAPYDLQNDAPWTVGGGASRLAIDLAWSTTDYTNTGNGTDDASAVSLDALTGTPVGDGSYMITSGTAIPNGKAHPSVAASGSGVAAIEGHPAVNVGSEAEPDEQRIAFTSGTEFFSIDEADGKAVPRRTSVDLNSCLDCHQTLSLHGSNRTDNVQLCVTCHNPRNTDREVRAVAANPPTDGKKEESLHFKTMIHGIHAAGMRENPLQVVGFRGFSTYVYDEEEVQFPGDLGNCTTCHTDDGFTLPLASGALGTTVDTGKDHQDPADDTVVSPIAAACSSCHDEADGLAHMTAQGASFSTTQEALDSGEVVEQCSVCHGSGKDFDVAIKHNVHSKPVQ